MVVRRGRSALPAGLDYRDRVDEVRQEEIDEFLERVGVVEVSDYNLFNRAFSHKSYTNEKGYDHNEQSEKLEFFGDGVLGLIMNEYLFKVFPESEEGDLAKIKSAVVSEVNLAEIAVEIDLADVILLGRSERRHGRKLRPSLLADILEAFMGALYIDQGLVAVRKFILRYFEASIRAYSTERSVGDYKSYLQEMVQKEYGERPVYRVLRSSGPDHSRTYRISVAFRGRVWGEGKGASKKEAEQVAAEDAWENWQERLRRRRDRRRDDDDDGRDRRGRGRGRGRDRERRGRDRDRDDDRYRARDRARDRDEDRERLREDRAEDREGRAADDDRDGREEEGETAVAPAETEPEWSEVDDRDETGETSAPENEPGHPGSSLTEPESEEETASEEEEPADEFETVPLPDEDADEPLERPAPEEEGYDEAIPAREEHEEEEEDAEPAAERPAPRRARPGRPRGRGRARGRGGEPRREERRSPRGGHDFVPPPVDIDDPVAWAAAEELARRPSARSRGDRDRSSGRGRGRKRSHRRSRR